MKIKKLTSALLAGIMAASAIPFSADIIPYNGFTAFAVEESAETDTISGECGESATFTLDSEGTLTISGTGGNFFTCGTGECTRWNGYYDSIKNVIIQDGITFIGDYAFAGCASLYSVTIPKSVVEIGEFAFDGCTSLSSVNIENPYCEIPMSDNTINNGISTDSSGSNYYDGKIYGFSDSTAQKYAEENGYKFELINTIITGECQSFSADGDRAYWSLENGVLTISGKGMVYCHRDYAPNGIVGFSPVWKNYTKHIKEVVVKEGITGVQHYCFAWMDNLEKITLPESLETIGGDAFCSSILLKEIYIPKNVKEIGADAFECHMKITVDPENPYILYDDSINTFFNKDKTELIYTMNGIRDYTVPSGVKIIGDHAFSYNGYSSLILPDSVTKIGFGAFEGCNIKTLNLPKYLTEVGRYAFQYANIETISIPGSVKKISESAFLQNYSLKNVIIDEGVEELGYGCFYYCNNLTEVVLPSTLKCVESAVFNRCDILDSVTFLNPDCEIKDSNSIPKETTIIGYDNSTAQEYAEKYNRKFTSLGEFTKNVDGDANCDGIVSMADAAAIYQFLGNPDKYSLSEQGAVNADVANNNNGITANDAIMIQKMIINFA